MSKRTFKAAFNLVFRRREIDLKLKEFSIDENTWNIRVEHPQVTVIAEALGKYFIECGASNFLEMTMFDPASIGVFTLTMQRMGKPNDAKVRELMRQALETIYADPDQARTVAEATLLKLGYLKPAERATP